jgi:hypothetical protein
MVSPVTADFIDGGFNNSIISAENWTAGVDDLGKWYGTGYTVADGAACLSLIGNGKNYGQMRKDQCGLFQALAMPEAGTYDWSVDNMLSNYDRQFDYWMVYAMKDSSRIDLSGHQLGFRTPRKAKQLMMGYAPNGNDDGQWHSYSDNFTISAKQARKYDYLGFVLVGSRHQNEMLSFDNVSTNVGGSSIAGVPEPGTAILALCGIAIFIGWTRQQPRRG